MKKLKINRWIIIGIIAIAVLIIGGTMFLNLKHFVNIRGQKLESFSYYSGGGMNGGGYNETIKKYDDETALYTVSDKDWWYQDPTVSEYFIDAKVLDEIDAVVRKYHMNMWHNKTFTHEIVFDGESESYHFNYDDATVWFSSQIYPLRYYSKLKKIKEVINKYTKDVTKLPGLVLENPIEDFDTPFYTEGETRFYVYEYYDKTLGIKMLNGTDKDIEIVKDYKLVNADTGKVLYEDNNPYTYTLDETSNYEDYIRLSERLEAGNYKLTFSDVEITFEIR